MAVIVPFLRKPKILISLIVIGLLVVSIFAYISKNYSFFSPKDKDLRVKQETEALVTKVGRHVLLPDEQPTIATVTDKAKLPQQEFYAKAEKGDKILLYTKARKAYLYRPSRDKLIEVSPLYYESELRNALDEQKEYPTASPMTRPSNTPTSIKSEPTSPPTENAASERQQ